MLLAFSCKRRAVCPSCTGRRAADCAAHLVDEVLPSAPIRQWVLTFPRPVRFALARDSRLATKVIAIGSARSKGFHRRRARGAGFPADAQARRDVRAACSGSALNLNVHLHTVVPDGAFAIEDQPSFVALPPPTTDEIEALLLRVVARVRRCVGRTHDTDDDTPLLDRRDAGRIRCRALNDGVRGQRAGRF